MRITIVTVDSRGDVQPCVALGLGLRAAGHEVRLATHPEHAALIPAHTLDLYPIETNPRTALENERQEARTAGRYHAAFTHRLIRTYGALMCRYMADCWEASQGADVIMYSASGFFARSIAEKRRIPYFPIFLQPVSPTRAFPHSLFGASVRLGGLYNQLTYTAVEQVSRQLWRRSINQARRDVLNLPPLPVIEWRQQSRTRCNQPYLYGFSPCVVPKPPDWGAWLHVTGYWFLNHPAQWQPPKELADFLKAGPPPVYVGFGSTNSRNTDAVTDIIVRALARAGQRGILSIGRSRMGTTALPGNMLAIESAPHDWLFPRVALAVHHGGAGTTAAALRAGIPSVIVPYFADQPFWARRAFDLGVAPRPIPRKHLSVERLAQAIASAAGDRAMAARATTLGASIRGEDGVACALEAFHHHMNGAA